MGDGRGRCPLHPCLRDQSLRNPLLPPAAEPTNRRQTQVVIVITDKISPITLFQKRYRPVTKQAPWESPPAVCGGAKDRRQTQVVIDITDKISPITLFQKRYRP